MKKILIIAFCILLSGCTENSIGNIPLKEFNFYNIKSRELYGGLGKSGSIGGVTSFYLTGTMNYDFEIMEKDIENQFVDKKVYIRKINNTKIQVCTTPLGKKCYKADGTIVEKFILSNGL